MNTDRSEIDVSPPEGQRYADLLDRAAEFCDRLRLVVFPDRDEYFRGKALLEALRPSLTDVERVREWPGSRLVNSEAELQTYRLSAELIRTVREQTDGLSSWGYPVLPDDPHFIRADGSLWFGSTVHEDWAWFVLSKSERLVLEDLSPELLRRQAPGSTDE